MIHTKFRGNQPAGSGEEDIFKGFLPFMGMAAILVLVMSSDFHFLVLESFHTKFGSDQHSIF